MNTIKQMEMKRFLLSMTLGLIVGVTTLGLEATARASGGSGGGGGNAAGTDPTATGTVIKLSNFKQNYNGSSAKGTVTLSYATDNSPQSITFSLSSINVPDGTVLPVNVVTGVYRTIISYYSYQVLEYTTTSGTLMVKNKSVTWSLNALNGDVIPPFSLPTIGTTDVHIYSADGTTEILGGSVGKLRP